MSRLTKKEKKQIVNRLIGVEKRPSTFTESMMTLHKAMNELGLTVKEASNSFIAFNKAMKQVGTILESKK